MEQQFSHYNDVITGANASQITSLTIVYSTLYSGIDQWKHQSSAVRGIHRWAGNSPHKWQTQKVFPFDDVIVKHGFGLVGGCVASQSESMTENCHALEKFYKGIVSTTSVPSIKYYHAFSLYSGELYTIWRPMDFLGFLTVWQVFILSITN